MALAKVGRKLRRTGKDAFKFKLVALCEEMTLQLKSDWSPSTLRVSLQRGHRRVSTSPALWKLDGSKKGGTASWDPPAPLELMITLYRSLGEEEFEEKEYKFQIENKAKDGEVKLLATFYCNVADYASLEGSHRVLSMQFKPSSKKIASASLDVTVETEFVKQGKAGDEDMMSTFSRVSRNSLKDVADDDEEDEDEEAVQGMQKAKGHKKRTKQNKAAEQTLARLAAASPEEDRDRTTSRIADWLGTPGDAAGQSNQPVDALLLSDSIFSKAVIHDANSEIQPIERLLTASIIGVYFSAEWCPPCRDFIPKLASFYTEVKSKSGSFEVLWISSDKNKESMMRYAQSFPMPWLMLEYDHPLGNELRDDFEVAAIPTLYVVDAVGNKLDHLGRATVEKAVLENTVWSAFNLWQANVSSAAAPAGGSAPKPAVPSEKADRPSNEKTTADHESVGKADTGEPKKGILQSVSSFITGKKSIHSHRDSRRVRFSNNSAISGDEENDMEKEKVQREVAVSIEPTQLADGHGDKSPSTSKAAKAHGKMRGEGAAKGKNLKDVYIEELEAKNQQLNDDVVKLREEVDDLQMMVQDLRQQVEVYEREKQNMEKRQQVLMVKLNLKGWLFKRGIKGPTRNIWRRRWFSLDDNGRLFYFAEDNDKSPKGFIDLNQMTGVQEKSPETQDKNNASFNLVTKDRTFELMAHDRETMQKWITSLDSYFSQLSRR